MATTTTQVRTASAADIPALAATFTEAFLDDPIFRWFCPDDDRRAQILPEFFRVVLEAAVPFGEVEAVEGEVAASLWVPPAEEFDEEALGAALAEVSGEYAERLFTLMELTDEVHPRVEHHYLFFLGTRIANQSMGLGSALIRSVTAECDRDGVPAYLEATSERNLSLYERHGFETVEVLTPPGGPPLTCMWREPMIDRTQPQQRRWP